VRDARLRESDVLGHRYVLEGLIGRGGMGEVYRARDRVLGRPVAVKLMRSVAADDTQRARFEAEARTLARMNHPGLVTILDAATTDEDPYLVMELVDGPSLAECCRGTALEPERVAAVGAQLADALGHAHAAGIVHRDLKPGNVLLGADDRALLADFGLARLMSDVVRHTSNGVTIGTAAYLAPEQVRGEDVTPAVDVFALGLVLLEALTGEQAYQGPPVQAALARLTSGPAIPDTVPPRWRELLQAMTALEAAQRPSTAAVAATLRELASGTDTATATAALRTQSMLRLAAPRTRSMPRIAAAARMLSGTRRGRTGGTPRAWSRSGPAAGRWAVTAACAALAVLLVLVLRGDDWRGSPRLPVTVPYADEQPLQDPGSRAVRRSAAPASGQASAGDGGQPASPPDAQRRDATPGAADEPARTADGPGGATGGSGVAAETPARRAGEPGNSRARAARAKNQGRGGGGAPAGIPGQGGAGPP
jgi:hypothetical protein